MPSTTIAVVIPTYNGEKFIEKAIVSLLQQTRPADEIIVVDDGSSDSTPDIVSRYPVKLIRQSRGGVSAARNRAISESSSDWIAFLDQDDWYDPQKLAIQESAITPDTVLNYSGLCVTEGNRQWSHQPHTPEYIASELSYRNLLTPGAVLVRRSALVQVGLFNPAVKGCEDWDLWIRLIKKGKFVAVPEAILNIRVHGDNYSLKPQEMLEAFRNALPMLLAGTSGSRRLVKRQRLISLQYQSAAVMCRMKGEQRRALSYCLRSLISWPIPERQFAVYRLLAIQLLNMLRAAAKPSQALPSA